MTPENYSNELKVSLSGIEPREMDKVADKYGKVMDAIDIYMTSSPNDFELLTRKEQIEDAKEDLLKKGTLESLAKLQTELMTASNLFNITDTTEVKSEEADDDLSALLFLDRDLPKERPAGFARLSEKSSAEEFAELYDQDQILEILGALADQQEKLPESTKAKLGQVAILGIILSAELSEFKEDDKDERKTDLISANEEILKLKELVITKPDADFNSLMSSALHKTLADCDGDYDLIDKSGNIKVATSIAELNKQHLALIDNLIGNKKYDHSQRLMEDVLLAPSFNKKSREISSDRLMVLDSQASSQAAKYVDQYRGAWMNPSAEMIAKGAKPLTNKQVIQLKIVFENMIFDQKKKEEAGKMLNASDFSTPLEKEVYEKYNAMLDPHDEWFTAKDANVDWALREIAINAPLIIISGGMASIFRMGLSAVTRSILFSAKFAGIMRKAGLVIDASEAVIATGSLGRGVLFAGGLAAAGSEALAFDYAYMGIQGEWLHKQPGWVTQVLWTGLTLGAFRFTGKQANVLDKLLTENITKFPDKSFQKILQKVLVHGSTGTATMLAIGAIQQGVMVGDFTDYNFATELFRALVSMGALTVVGAGTNKFIEIGKKRFSPRRTPPAGGGGGKGPEGGRERARRKPFEVGKARGVETAPDGTMMVKGVANSLFLRLRLTREGYKIEKTPEGIRATSKSGEVVEVKSSPEVRAFEAKVGRILTELGSLKNPTDAQVKGVMGRLMKVLLPMILLFSSGCGASKTAEGVSKTWEGLKAIPEGFDSLGGGITGVISGVGTLGQVVILILGAGLTVKTYPSLAKGLRMLNNAVSKSSIYKLVDSSANQLSGLGGSGPNATRVRKLGEIIARGGTLP
ncbi:MAG: hypothetical protein WCX95_05440, partial [Candidatus Gracilibacteria bacterium]